MTGHRDLKKRIRDRQAKTGESYTAARAHVTRERATQLGLLHGCGLCLWRLGNFAEAQRVFERILSLDPNDNQGTRFCWEAVRQGRSWEEVQEREWAAGAEGP
jgi:tetratricopeptide (TPR) repeat protein